MGRSLGARLEHIVRPFLGTSPRLLVCLLLALLASVSGPVVTAAPLDQPSVNEASPIDVLMTEYTFTPAEIVASPGAVRLRIVNAGIRRHNVVVLVDGQELKSPHLRPGEVTEWQIQIDQPGRYHVWCNEYVHLEKGMVAVLVVE